MKLVSLETRQNKNLGKRRITQNKGWMRKLWSRQLRISAT